MERPGGGSRLFSGSGLRAIAVDLDGTLMDQKGALPEANRKALERFRREVGGPVVVATGRGSARAVDGARFLGESVTHIVCHDGGIVLERETDPAALAGSSLDTATLVHRGIACDGCKMSPITGIRYQRLDHQNFDFCESCYQKHLAETPVVSVSRCVV